jgi:hypothetical protein
LRRHVGGVGSDPDPSAGSDPGGSTNSGSTKSDTTKSANSANSAISSG